MGALLLALAKSIYCVISMEFLRLLLSGHFKGKLVLALRSVGCFIRVKHGGSKIQVTFPQVRVQVTMIEINEQH